MIKKKNNYLKTIELIGSKILNGFRLVFIPHRNNAYRPHLIRRYGLVALLLFVIGFQLYYNSATTGNVLGRQSDITISVYYQ